jgi:hypothetical protein
MPLSYSMPVLDSDANAYTDRYGHGNRYGYNRSVAQSNSHSDRYSDGNGHCSAFSDCYARRWSLRIGRQRG